MIARHIHWLYFRYSLSGAASQGWYVRSSILIAFFMLAACGSPTLADTLNSLRQAHGLPALHRSRTLQAMAQSHAKSMAARHSMDHAGFYSERGPAGARAANVARGCAYAFGRNRQAIARTCCWPTSKTTA